jgi:hypothetical protein
MLWFAAVELMRGTPVIGYVPWFSGIFLYEDLPTVNPTTMTEKMEIKYAYVIIRISTVFEEREV